jgi:putative nucleotidyltransferase with HDIG domain
MKLFRRKPLRQRATKTSRIEKRVSPFRFFKVLALPSNLRIIVCLLLAAAIAILIAPQLRVPRYSYAPGDIARQTIRSHQDLSVEDPEATEKRRLEAERTVLAVYDVDSRAEEKIAARVAAAFGAMRDMPRAASRPGHPADTEHMRDEFSRHLKAQVADSDFEVLRSREFKQEIEDYLLELTLPIARREIVATKEQLYKERGRGIRIRDIYTRDEITAEDLSPIIDLKEAHNLMVRDAREVLANVRIDVRRVIQNIAVKLIDPTITFNQIETQARKNAARREVSPLYSTVKKGEIIVREGARINEATLIRLQALSSLAYQTDIYWNLSGLFLFSFLTLLLLYRFARTSIMTSAGMKVSHGDVLFLCATLLITFGLIKLGAGVARLFSKGYEVIPMDAYVYALPFAFAAMVISVVLSPRVAALSSIVIGIFACFLLDSRFVFFLYAFLSSIVAAQEVRHCRERKTIIRAGLVVGGINVLLVLSLSLISADFLKVDTAICAGFAVLGGLMAAVLATGFIPIVEMTFNYTTDIKLLELSDLNQPALRRLLISAPGTYHHSILVGILAEAAAEAINANPLLARVSAYYHDIGKIKKPLYFVENQKGVENKHDKLQPSMSSLIITTHVKDGMEIAREFRLGKPIMDIIAQHHGTTVITYFYQKAKELGEAAGKSVSDKEFRYPGPKPQTKEAGIVMLADAVQATSKTLSDPTPARIQNMVQRIINNIFVDGQLDECELTLKDLHLIAGSFNRILNGIFHTRIDYPEKSKKDDNGKDLDKKPAKTDSDQPAPHPEDGERDLGKRIGISKSRNKHSAAG